MPQTRLDLSYRHKMGATSLAAEVSSHLASYNIPALCLGTESPSGTQLQITVPTASLLDAARRHSLTYLSAVQRHPIL